MTKSHDVRFGQAIPFTVVILRHIVAELSVITRTGSCSCRTPANK